MRIAAALAPLLILVACATPRESCINEANRDLRQVNALIIETQGNLARGFGLETRQDTRVRRGRCTGQGVGPDGEPFSFRYDCDRTEVVDTQVPITIDRVAEQRKLTQLIAQQRQLERQAQAQVQACIAAYPE